MIALFFLFGTFQSILAHFVYEGVDEVLTVAKVTAVNKVVLDLSPPSFGVGQFEVPHGVGHLLELGSARVDLVDHVLNADHTMFAYNQQYNSYATSSAS